MFSDHSLFIILNHVLLKRFCFKIYVVFISVELLDTADKVQLEVKYRLPSISNSKKTRPKLIQVKIKIITSLICSECKIVLNIAILIKRKKYSDAGTERKWKLWNGNTRRCA